ncbi:MAG: transglutaminase domain-containing protein [Thioclava marina]|uniref:transglutaminase-like domain-containing protein n=1 Tax=Thioclava marina TaxID=1915077 RepID=UPI00198F629D|nr:transglutaminase-like domain-containing protein [Thioclava marina]MBC7145543.1 transglutaminase domain-containing protein [Thioclava marina]
MNRRNLMQCGAAAMGMMMMPRMSLAAFTPKPEGWRKFELVTKVTLPASDKGAQLWLPVPSVHEAGWMKPGEASWTSGAQSTELVVDPEKGTRMLHAVWGPSDAPRELVLVAIASTQDFVVDLDAAQEVTPLSADERARYLAPTDLLPTDGIVRETADEITRGKRGDLEKARAIYEWIVENTARNPKTRGCGLGDIASMLTMGDLSGKCADLNALFVGLARAAGLPARDVYGLRVAPSRFGYKSLGAKLADITKAQHCRAEVYLDAHGWVPVDPADVRKVMLEEPPGNLKLDDPKVVDVRRALFGAWEGNWVAYNYAHDVALPGSDGPKVPYLMYPQAELDGVRRDSLDPASFTYEITVREIAA